MKIYGDIFSGNCFKVRLVCSFLDIKYDWVDLNVLEGDTKKEHFLSINPNGQVPVAVFSDGRKLTESNAIVNYLATGSKLMPSDTFQLAQLQQWQFFEQSSLQPYLASARFILKRLGMPVERKVEYDNNVDNAKRALKILDQHLLGATYIVGDQLTTADICLYAYCHVLNEAGLEFSSYPFVSHWLKRIQASPKYQGM